MISIKEQIPDSESLKSKLKQVLESGLSDFLGSTKDSRKKVEVNFRLVLIALLFLLSIFIFIFLSGAHLNDGWFGKVVLILSLIWTTVFLVYGRAWFANTKLLAREMNMALVPILTNTLGRVFLYTHNSDHKEETKHLLSESELMTIGGVEVESDDMYTVYGDNEASFRELKLTKRLNQKGESDTPVELFKGVFVTLKLNQSHSAKTFISTDGDRRGFAHKNFWVDLLGGNKVQETILEWNDFEEHLHVASSDATAAREILTPDFMQHLYDWWLEHKLNIRIAFKGDMLYMLLPEAKIRIGSITTSTKPAAIQKYSWSLLLPIWRSLLLVEDVSR